MAYDVTPDKLQEVLHVSVDQTQFAEGLSNLLKVWNDFVAKIGSENVGAVVGVGAFEGIKQEIDLIRTEMQQFNLSMQQDSNEAAASVNKAADSIIEALARIQEAEAAANAHRSTEVPLLSVPVTPEGVNNQNAGLLEQERLYRQVNSAHEQALKMEEKRSQTFLGNLGREFVELAKYQLLWSSFGAILGGIGKLFSLPFDTIKEGIQYIKETTEMSDKLTGVLATNYRWSNNFAENMDKAGKSSDYLVKKLQDVAVADRLNFKGLAQIAETLSQSNATRSITDMKDLVKLTELFGLAMRGAKLDGNNARAVISEIPKLFTDGVIPATSKFLQILQLSPKQWVKFREEGEKAGDLIPRITQRMNEYGKAAIDASGHTSAIAENAELVKQRWEALVAGPILTEFTRFMAKILDWAQEHKKALDDLGRLIGNVLSEGAKTLLMTDNWKNGLAGVVSMFAKIAVLAAEAANVTRFMVEMAVKAGGALSGKAILNLIIDPGKSPSEKSFSDIFSRFQKEGDALQNQLYKIDDLNKQLSSPSKPEPDPAIAGAKLLAPPPHPAKDGKTSSPYNGDNKATLSETLAQIRSDYEAKSSVVRESEASQLITRREALERTKAFDAEEIKAAETARDNYVANLELTGKKRDAALKNASTLMIDLRRQIASREHTDERAVAKEDVKDYITSQQDKLKRKQEFARAELAVQQELAAQGYNSEVALIDKTIEADKREFTERVKFLRSWQAAYAEGTPERIRLVEEEKQAQAQYTISFAENTTRRMGALERETQFRREAEAQMAQIRSQDKIALLEAEDATRSFKHVLDEVYQEQQKQISTLTKIKQAQIDEAIATGKTTEVIRAYRLELAQLNSTSLANVFSQIEKIRGSSTPFASKQVMMQKLADNALEGAKSNNNTASDALGTAVISGASAETIKDLTKSAEEAAKALKDMQEYADQVGPSFDKFKDGISEMFLGNDWDTLKGNFKDAGSTVDKMGVAAGAAATGLQTMLTVVDAYKQGSAKGGVLGGIGGVMSALTPALENLPVVGQFVGLAAGVFSFVGGLFTNAAKKAAENINKAFSKTMEEFNNGSLDIKDAILQVNEERNQAIRELSGKKGGKDELNKLLPEFDRQLQSLNKTREQTITTFNDGLADLRLHSDTLATMSQTWRDINKQVKDYIAAGGDAASASEFIALKLAKVKEDQISQLSAGEQTAIQDAISLNNLLQQKIDLEKQYNAQRFALANADSLERRGVGSVVRGQQLKDQEAANKKQLDDINSQINLATQKVAIEGTMFNLVGSIAELHRRDEALTLQALQLQINKYAEMKNLIGAISVGNLGLVGISTPPSSGSTTVTINGGVNISSPPNMGGPGGDYTPPPGYVGPGPDYRPDAIGRAVAMHVGNEVSKEIARQRRLYPHGAV